MRRLTFDELKTYLEEHCTNKTIQKQYGHHNLVSYDIKQSKTITLDLANEVIWSVTLGYGASGYVLFSQEAFMIDDILYIGIEM